MDKKLNALTTNAAGNIARSGIPIKKKDIKKAEKKEPQAPSDKVEISGEKEPKKEKKPLKSVVARKARKTFASATGKVFGTLNMLNNAVLGAKEGVTHAVKPEKDVVSRKKSVHTLSIINHALSGAAIGAYAFGPIGLVLGGIGGFISGKLRNFLDYKSGTTDRFMDNVDNAVDGQIDKLPKKENSSMFRKAVNGGVKGAIAGAKDGWIRGNQIGQATGAGLLDGFGFIAEDIKDYRTSKKFLEHVGNPTTRPDENQNIFTKTLKKSVGVVSGVSGVLMNVPGGAIEGTLQAVEPNDARKDLTRASLLLGTNAGKILPAAIVGAVTATALSGPIGVAASTAVGAVTGSLTTIIDGRYGFNRGIVYKVRSGVFDVVDDDYRKDGVAPFHNASKGAIAGAYMGLKEGWRLGYKGGVEYIEGMFDSPIVDEERERMQEKLKQMEEESKGKGKDKSNQESNKMPEPVNQNDTEAKESKKK